MSGDFQEKVVLVTGGASGIGKETVQQFLAEGAKVVFTDLNEAKGNALCASSDYPDRLRFKRQDVAEEADWEAVFDFVRTEFGTLDVLVNNAGIAISTPLEKMSLEEWRLQHAVNLDAVFLGTRFAIKEMKGRGGAIVNISSVAGEVGIFAAPAYCSSKAAVLNFTKATALYCGQYKYNIRVNAILPGYTETPLVEDVMAQQGSPGSFGEKLKSMHPIGHFGEPADIAAGILFAASDKARFMTGSAIPIDGGYLAQ